MRITKKQIAELARRIPGTFTQDGVVPESHMNIRQLKLGVTVTDENLRNEGGKESVSVNLYFTDATQHKVDVQMSFSIVGSLSADLPIDKLYVRVKEGYKRKSYTQVEDVLYKLTQQVAASIRIELKRRKQAWLEGIKRLEVPVLTPAVKKQVEHIRRDHNIPQGFTDLFKGEVKFVESYGQLYVTGYLKDEFKVLSKDVLYGFMERTDGVSRAFEVLTEGSEVFVRYTFEGF